jgi:endonuclease-3
MAESLTQLKKKYRDAVKRMTRKYGVAKLSGSGADVEQCVYLILREGWDFRKVNKAVKIIAEEFVDWNEVRVSVVKEVREAVSFLKYKDLDAKLTRVKAFLGELYGEYNRLNLEFLLEAEFEETRRTFAEFEHLGRANAYIFLQCLQDELDDVPVGDSVTLVMSTEALRVGIRLGLIRKTSSHNVARKEFLKLMESKEAVVFQNLFVRHGEQICTSKNPMCKECFLNTICNYCKS